MPTPPLKDADLVAAHNAWIDSGKSRLKTAKALGLSRTALQRRLEAFNARRAHNTPKPQLNAPVTGAGISAAAPNARPKRILVIPDTQIRPNVQWVDTMRWVGLAIAHYRPDVVVHIGDHWDFPSLSKHEERGSVPMEGLRYQDDLKAGNDAFALMCAPMEELERTDPSFRPRKIFCMGNHELRADRAASEDAKLFGTIGSENCDIRDWERHPFLERVWESGICFSHYFQSSHSHRPIGGEVSNRLNRVGASFVQGHEQGFKYGNRVTGAGAVWHGIVAGSCYSHIEPYRGAQGQKHWRGLVVLNECHGDGDASLMNLTLDYLCRRFEGVGLHEFMVRKYPYQKWEHLK